jgi:hypothetical protein
MGANITRIWGDFKDGQDRKIQRESESESGENADRRCKDMGGFEECGWVAGIIFVFSPVWALL